VNDNQLQYDNLRKIHPEFVFEKYAFSESDEGNVLDITYHFSIPGLARFEPTWSFTGVNLRQRNIDCDCLKRLIFSLGMAELISYWKISCPPVVRIESGNLTTAQIAWWKKLYLKGLGEYFYVNGIVPGDNFIEIICPTPSLSSSSDSLSMSLSTPSAPGKISQDAAASGQPKVLIPIGGGKDSVLTLELLRESADRYAYIINPRQATRGTAEAAALGKEKLITAKRTLDKNMLTLNTKGYLNGHTPFSAIVAFSSVLAGYASGMDYVALSNESSANETTVANSDVNHQYSKSFEFETDFRQYEREYIASNVEYFSLLRPLLELQIARLFARNKKYHPVFQSCNTSEKTNEWCGICPKCLFVYIVLSPFLSEYELVSIFRKNLFEDETLALTLDKLSGFTAEKPFECVGRRDEVRAALELTLNEYEKTGKQIPPLLSHYKQVRDSRNLCIAQSEINKILTYFDDNNAVPPRFISLVNGAAERRID